MLFIRFSFFSPSVGPAPRLLSRWWVRVALGSVCSHQGQQDTHKAPAVSGQFLGSFCCSAGRPTFCCCPTSASCFCDPSSSWSKLTLSSATSCSTRARQQRCTLTASQSEPWQAHVHFDCVSSHARRRLAGRPALPSRLCCWPQCKGWLSVQHVNLARGTAPGPSQGVRGCLTCCGDTSALRANLAGPTRTKAGSWPQVDATAGATCSLAEHLGRGGITRLMKRRYPSNPE